ncbi:MAG: tetratricopeptide repeat protein [Puniceicoccales bacterium]
MRTLSLLLLTSFSAATLIAQAPPSVGLPTRTTPKAQPAAAPAAQPSNANTMNVGSGGGMFESETLRAFSKDLFDTDSDAVDLEEGTLNWKGRTFAIGNSRVVRARFERYLATPALPDDEDVYLGIIERVHELLSQVGQGEVKDAQQLNDELFEAWQLLFVAARYEMDGGTSLVIANQVYNVWRIRDENVNLDQAQVMLAEEQSKIQDELVSGDWYKKVEFDENQRLKAQGRHTGETFEGITEATFRAERLAETQARITGLEAQRVTNGLQAKLQFQSQLLNMLLSRRFEHCLIGCMFYRYVFKGSHMQMIVGQEQLKGFIPISDFSPTVETLEFIAREAMADVKSGMRTVETLYDGNERYGALERLQETYYLGEYMPQVLEFPPEKKRELLKLYRLVREVQMLADLKDYGAIEASVDQIGEIAQDFPAARVLSAVRSAERLSNLSLLAAQQALAMGQTDKAEKSLARATEIWPLNPAIKTFTLDIANRADISTQATLMFDQLYTREDYRQIYDRRTEFAAALMQDPLRSEQLQQVAERVGTVDMLIAAAQEQSEQENAYEAWEMLLRATDLEPNDPSLARAKAAVAPRVADFVGAVDAAERAEKNGQYAVSLSRFLAAQDIYPASKTCRIGIERVSQELMAQIKSSEAEKQLNEQG